MALQQHLFLLEVLTGQVAPAGCLEQGQVPAGLFIPLFLQPCQCACPEEHLWRRGPGEGGSLGWGQPGGGTSSGHRKPAGPERGPWPGKSLKTPGSTRREEERG